MDGFVDVLSYIIVGVGLMAGVGELIVRVCFFPFTLGDVGDDSLRLVIVVGEYPFEVV